MNVSYLNISYIKLCFISWPTIDKKRAGFWTGISWSVKTEESRSCGSAEAQDRSEVCLFVSIYVHLTTKELTGSYLLYKALYLRYLLRGMTEGICQAIIKGLSQFIYLKSFSLIYKMLSSNLRKLSNNSLLNVNILIYRVHIFIDRTQLIERIEKLEEYIRFVFSLYPWFVNGWQFVIARKKHHWEWTIKLIIGM